MVNWKELDNAILDWGINGGTGEGPSWDADDDAILAEIAEAEKEMHELEAELTFEERRSLLRGMDDFLYERGSEE